MPQFAATPSTVHDKQVVADTGQVLSPAWPDRVDKSFFSVMLPTAEGIGTSEAVQGAEHV